MKKKYRLCKNYDFQRIILGKKQIVTKTLILYYELNNEHIKVGLSISKKFANAVGRNNIRRRMRSIFNEIKIWNIEYNCVLIVRKGFIGLDYNWQKLEIIKIFKGLVDGTKQK